MPRAAHNSHRKRPVSVTTAGPDDPLDTPRWRFGRQVRLPGQAAFNRVFSGGERSRDRYFTVLFRPNGLRRARLGLAIAKKHCRLAANRNRQKRIVRESFRRYQQALAGLDVVVLNNPETQAADNPMLFSSLAAHWQRCTRKQSEQPDG